MDAIPCSSSGATLDYDAVIADEEALHAALVELYPTAPLRRVRFIDGAFGAYREHQFARRKTDEYRRLSAIAEAVQRSLDAETVDAETVDAATVDAATVDAATVGATETEPLMPGSPMPGLPRQDPA
jgi:hypothetical protein